MTLSYRLVAVGLSAVLMNACVIRLSDGGRDHDSPIFEEGSGGSAGAYQTGGDDQPGGFDSCVGVEGTGQTTSACEMMGITPDVYSEVGWCGPASAPPLGYLSCYRAFEIFEPGHAEAFADCLADISADDACTDEPVYDCVDQVYDDACPRLSIEEGCEAIDQACVDWGDYSFDDAQCAVDLLPFNEDALGRLIDCMNDETIGGDCQQIFDTCFEELSSI